MQTDKFTKKGPLAGNQQPVGTYTFLILNKPQNKPTTRIHYGLYMKINKPQALNKSISKGYK